MSSLPMLRFCGPSADLSEKHGSQRTAAVSTAFHARCANSPNAVRLLTLLTADELHELEGWHMPPDVTVDDHVLRYADAEKELTVGLDRLGYYSDSPDCLTVGHLDFAWKVGDLAYVADIKRSRWTTPEGPDSLQLHAYGRAYALMRGCDSYCTGIWAATDGLWLWSEEVVELDSERAENLWYQIYHAATQALTEYASGPHCHHCYGRLHCQEYAIPAHTQETWLTPIAGDDIEQKLEAMSPAERGEFLFRLKALKKVAAAAEDQCDAAVSRGLEFVHKGKRWGMKQMPGRKSLNKERLLATLVAEGIGGLEQFEVVGKEYEQGAWLKESR